MNIKFDIITGEPLEPDCYANDYYGKKRTKEDEDTISLYLTLHGEYVRFEMLNRFIFNYQSYCCYVCFAYNCLLLELLDL